MQSEPSQGGIQVGGTALGGGGVVRDEACVCTLGEQRRGTSLLGPGHTSLLLGNFSLKPCEDTGFPFLILTEPGELGVTDS